MTIIKEQLQECVIKTREFLSKAQEVIEHRSDALRQQAVDNSLFINYTVGLIVLRNVQAQDKKIAERAEHLGLQSTSGFISQAKGWFYSSRPVSMVKNWFFSTNEPQWQGEARDLGQKLRQTLLRAQEWLELEEYDLDHVTKAIPTKTHVEYQAKFAELRAAFNAVESLPSYKKLLTELTPMSQRKTWLSEEMKTAMNFIRLRVDWRLIQNYRDKILARKTEDERKQFESIDVVKLGQDDLADMTRRINDSEESELFATNATTKLFVDNFALDQYLPYEQMTLALNTFRDAQAKANDANQALTADELGKIVDMNDSMPRPPEFVRGSRPS